MRPLSYTQIALYRSCPLHYKLQYVDKLKPKDKWYFSFGATLHLCTEYFFKVSAPPPPALNQLLQFYEENWLSEGYESREEEEQYKAYGREVLTKFWEIHSADFRMPVAVERLFNVDIGGVRLVGIIDRVDKLDSGLSIVDYKTTRELFTKDDLEQDLQLTLYQLAAEQTWRLPVEQLTLYHLRSNTPCSCGPRGREQLDEVRQLALQVAEGLIGGQFSAIENEYCPCDFPEHCPYYRHKYAERTGELRREGILQGRVVEDVIEQYASMQGQIKELELELSELRQTLIDYCEAEGLNRVFSKEHAITYRLMERTGFGEEEVRALLEPAGLWNRVLSFDQSKLKELLSSREIADDLRNKLASLKLVVSQFPRLNVKKLTTGEE